MHTPYHINSYYMKFLQDQVPCSNSATLQSQSCFWTEPAPRTSAETTAKPDVRSALFHGPSLQTLNSANSHCVFCSQCLHFKQVHRKKVIKVRQWVHMSSHWFTGYLVLSAYTGAMIQVPCIYLFFLFLPLLPKHLKAKQQSSCCQRTRNPRAAPHSQAPEKATASPMRASSVPCAKRKARDEHFRPHLDRDSRGATFGSIHNWKLPHVTQSSTLKVN